MAPFHIPGIDSFSFSVFQNKIFLGRGREHMFNEKFPMAQVSTTLAKQDFLFFWRPGTNSIYVLNFKDKVTSILKIPESIESYHVTSDTTILFQTKSKHIWYGHIEVQDGQKVLEMYPTAQPSPREYLFVTTKGNFLFANEDKSHVIVSKKPIKDTSFVDLFAHPRTNATQYTVKSFMLKNNQILSVINTTEGESDYLEIVNLDKNSIRTIKWIQTTYNKKEKLSFNKKVKKSVVSVHETDTGDLLILQDDGSVWYLEMDLNKIQQSLKMWRNIIGVSKEEPIQITYSGDVQTKLGNMLGDANGKSGGFNMEGGSGNSNAPGMGGKGSPFRQGSTHTITKSTVVDKKAYSEQATKEAREAAQKAILKRLAEIDMSEYDSKLYEKYYVEVATEISSLRVILEGVEARAKERIWTFHQTSGDFDDRKLVEGITGEKSVYKKRNLQDPEPGAPQEKPKRIRFVLDISGSMFRFNSQDKRLERLILTTLMIMEAFYGFEHKYQYSIVGHSGDGPEIKLVEYGKPPMNRNERFKILKKMIAHSEHCSSGDSTVEAVQTAIENVGKQDADDYFVFAVSDANLARYGVKPTELGAVLAKDPKVNSYVIFIASLGDEADQFKFSLPVGKAFVCLDTKKLPGIFKQIFTSLLLKSNE